MFNNRQIITEKIDCLLQVAIRIIHPDISYFLFCSVVKNKTKQTEQNKKYDISGLFKIYGKK